MDNMDDRVKKCDDGKYRWIYELSLSRNPSVFYTLCKVVIISYFAPLLVLMVVSAREGSMIDTLKWIAPIYLLCGLVLAIVVGLTYYFIYRYYNGSFTFLYEMDEESITLNRYGDDVDKTKLIGQISALTGVLTGSAGLAGSGSYVAASNSARSNFRSVYSIKPYPERDLIKVNSPFLFNEIYVNKQDYDFVLEYIRSHVEQAKQ